MIVFLNNFHSEQWRNQWKAVLQNLKSDPFPHLQNSTQICTFLNIFLNYEGCGALKELSKLLFSNGFKNNTIQIAKFSKITIVALSSHCLRRLPLSPDFRWYTVEIYEFAHHHAAYRIHFLSKMILAFNLSTPSPCLRKILIARLLIMIDNR